MKLAWFGAFIWVGLKWAVALGFGSFLLTLFLLWRNAHPPRYPYQYPPHPVIPLEEVTFTTSDGIRLKGSFSWVDPDRPTVLLCHGIGANRTDLYPFAELLVTKGKMNVFSFDFRAHGESAGSLTSYGALEMRDLASALDFLEGRGLSRNYGCMGISMGGSVALLVASRDQRIRAVWVDSPYSDLGESIAIHLQLLYHLPSFPFLPLAFLSYRLLFGVPIQEVSPIRSVGKVSPRPLFITSGGADDRMRPAAMRQLYEEAKDPKDLWIIPGAGHLEGHLLRSSEYDERLLRFFTTALAKP